MSRHLEQVNSYINYWWTFLISGLILILLAIFVYANPDITYAALSLAFAMVFVTNGILEMTFAISSHKSLIGWGWYVAGGIFDLFIAIVFFTNPILAAASLPLFVGFWLLIRSVLLLGRSFQIKKKGLADWPWLLFSGLAGLFFSLVNIYNPLFGSDVVIFWTAAALLVVGIFYLHFSMRIRKTQHWIISK
ncbi:HdeD family acid-resistance protein [Dyadobacter sp. 3J3]|uniref:HdeD family acid-resistance protein n=1 Tax=Dyadobacter sp. 3J3 TaxID=2606600 RepID=UPI0013587C78|nr:DUF308 domain-containing protein [Dyadobacter sp. 3J3]